MNKVLLIAVFMFASLAANAQTFTITNNNSNTVNFVMVAGNGSGMWESVYYSIPGNTGPTTFNMSTVSWANGAPPPSTPWVLFRAFNPCGTTALSACSGHSTNMCFVGDPGWIGCTSDGMNTSTTCNPSSYVKVVWTNSSGNISVALN
jgi:hypothetical protein